MDDHTIASKYCPRCQTQKPATVEYFATHNSARDGLQWWCRTCKSEYNRMTYSANKVGEAKRGKEWRAANPTYKRAQYYSNKERQREYNRRYRESNRQARRAADHRREALKRNAEGCHTAEDEVAQYKAQKGRCYYCRIKVGDSYHIDHVIPLSRGGSNGPENIVVACPTCNISKNDRLPHEWPEGGKLL